MARSTRVPHQHFEGNGITRRFDRRTIRAKAKVAFIRLFQTDNDGVFIPLKARHVKGVEWMGGHIYFDIAKLARK